MGEHQNRPYLTAEYNELTDRYLVRKFVDTDNPKAKAVFDFLQTKEGVDWKVGKFNGEPGTIYGERNSPFDEGGIKTAGDQLRRIAVIKADNIAIAIENVFVGVQDKADEAISFIIKPAVQGDELIHSAEDFEHYTLSARCLFDDLASGKLRTIITWDLQPKDIDDP